MNTHLILRRIILCSSILFIRTSFAGSTDNNLLSPLPDQWLYVPDHTQTAPSEDRWWKEFGDSTLNMLISRAETNNYNAAAAMKRIQIARREMEITRSGYSPDIGLSAGWSASQVSGATSSPVSDASRSSRFSAGLSMQWEIDLFGKISRRLKADRAAVDVSRAEYDALMVSLCANVAKTYLQLRTYQMQYRVATDHIESQKRF